MGKLGNNVIRNLFFYENIQLDPASVATAGATGNPLLLRTRAGAPIPNYNKLRVDVKTDFTGTRVPVSKGKAKVGSFVIAGLVISVVAAGAAHYKCHGQILPCCPETPAVEAPQNPTAKPTKPPVSKPTTPPSVQDDTTFIPAEDDTTFIPAEDDVTTFVPAQDDTTTFIPAQDDTTTFIPAQDDTTTFIPAGQDDTTTFTPSGQDGTTFTPASTTETTTTFVPSVTTEAPVTFNPAATEDEVIYSPARTTTTESDVQFNGFTGSDDVQFNPATGGDTQFNSSESGDVQFTPNATGMSFNGAGASAKVGTLAVGMVNSHYTKDGTYLNRGLQRDLKFGRCTISNDGVVVKKDGMPYLTEATKFA